MYKLLQETLDVMDTFKSEIDEVEEYTETALDDLIYEDIQDIQEETVIDHYQNIYGTLEFMRDELTILMHGLNKEIKQ